MAGTEEKVCTVVFLYCDESLVGIKLFDLAVHA